MGIVGFLGGDYEGLKGECEVPEGDYEVRTTIRGVCF